MNFNNKNFFIDQNLPQPLSDKEIKNLFISYKNGNMESRNTIIYHNIRWVLSLVENLSNKYYLDNKYEKSELTEVGVIGLIKSVDSFKIEKEFKFITYATQVILNEIRMFIRSTKKYNNDISMETPMKVGNKSFSKIQNTFYDDMDLEYMYEEKELKAIIKKLVLELPLRERKIMLLNFGFINNKVYTQKEIALICDLSQSRISRTIKEILQKLRIELLKIGIIERNYNQEKFLK